MFVSYTASRETSAASKAPHPGRQPSAAGYSALPLCDQVTLFSIPEMSSSVRRLHFACATRMCPSATLKMPTSSCVVELHPLIAPLLIFDVVHCFREPLPQPAQRQASPRAAALLCR